MKFEVAKRLKGVSPLLAAIILIAGTIAVDPLVYMLSFSNVGSGGEELAFKGSGWMLVERGANFERWFNGTHYRWASAPQWVWNGSAYVPYIFEDRYVSEGYYQVRSGLIGAKIYDCHAAFYDPNMTEVRVYDERWEVQQLKNGKWNNIGAQSGTPIFSISQTEKCVNITKAFHSWAGWLNITYIFREGEPLKHQVTFRSEIEGTFRILQKWSGIQAVKVRCNQGEQLISTATTVNSSSFFEFLKGSGVLSVREDQSGAIEYLYPATIDLAANGLKANFIFGDWNLTAGEEAMLDPDTATIQISTGANDGDVWGYHPEYDLARTEPAFASARPNGDYVLVGQTYFTDTHFYRVFRTFLKFDTSSIPTSATVSSASLKLYCYAKYLGVHFQIKVLRWTGDTPIDSRDLVKYSTATTYGSLSTTSLILDWNSIGIVSSAIVKGGYTKFALLSSRDLSATAPTGDEFVCFRTYEYSSSLAPKLEITYTVNQPPNAPTLDSPAANAHVNPSASITFGWTFNDPDSGDSQSAYQFQLDDNSDFSSPIIDTGKVSSSTSSTTQTLPSTVGLYYWRVKTWDSQDAEGEWSNGRAIIVDRVNVALNGLVGYWRFDEGSGDIAGDSSGLINNGTIYGATWVDGKYGKALSFDGVGYVEVPYHPSLDPPSITFLAWIKIKEWRTTTPYHEPIVKQGDSSNNFGFAVNHRGALNKKLYLVSASGGTNPGDFSAGTVEANRWYLVGFIWEDLTASTSRQELILNGEIIASREINVPKPSILTDIYIGRGIVFWEDNKFNGFIDEVRIYNRALSPEEIKALYLRGVDRVVEVGSSQNIQVDAYYEYDGGPFSGSITLNDTLTKDTVGKYGFKVASVTDDNYGLTAFTTGETTIIWDRIKIISSGVVDFTIDVDVGGKIWYYAVYEYDNSTFDDSCGVLYVNGFEMTWNGEKWIYAFPYSTEGNQITFHITGVLDSQYGLTEINNQVGDIIINWATMTIEIKRGW
ncbi:MAG: LamG-like jellyroll fold domain-containing protein, partial [Candidatus Heimdallarchaeota archaeon]